MRLAVLVVALLALSSGIAFAWFTSLGAGSGAANAGSLDAPTLAAPTPGAGTVDLSWTAVTPPQADTVTYTVSRETGEGAVSGTCTGSLSGTSCTDSGLAAGTYHYTVTAHWRSWTAASNAESVTLASGALDHFALTAASTTPTAGQGDDLTITAKDADGKTVTAYAGDKSLTFSGASTIGSHAPTVTDKDGTVVEFGTSGTLTFVSGVATVSDSSNGLMKLYKVESPTIQVSDGSHTGSTTVTVNPSALASFTVAPVSGTQTAGTAFSETLTAYDAYGNQKTDYTGSVTVTSNDPSFSVAGSNPYTFTSGGGADNGQHVFSVTLKTAGASKTVTITDGGVTATGTFTVNPGPAVTVTKTAGDSQSANVNSTFATQLTVRVTDAWNNPVEDGTSVTFTAPASGASATFASGGNCTSNPDARTCVATTTGGNATSSTFTAGAAPGSYQISAAAGSGSVNFNETNNASVFGATNLYDNFSGPKLTINTSHQTATGASVTTVSNRAELIFVHVLNSNQTSATTVSSITGPFTGATQVAGFSYASKDYEFVWKAMGNGAGPSAVTVTFDSGTTSGTVAIEVVELAAGNVVLPCSSCTNSGSGTATSATLSIQNASDTEIAFFGIAAGKTFSVPENFAQVAGAQANGMGEASFATSPGENVQTPVNSTATGAAAWGAIGIEIQATPRVGAAAATSVVATSDTTAPYTVTSGSFTPANGAVYMVFVGHTSSAGDSATLSTTGSLSVQNGGNPTTSVVNGVTYGWAWEVTGTGTSSATITATFAKANSKTVNSDVIQVIQLTGAGSIPFVGSGTTTSASVLDKQATVNGSASPAAGDSEIAFLYVNGDTGGSDPGWVTPGVASLANTYQHHGAADTGFGTMVGFASQAVSAATTIASFPASDGDPYVGISFELVPPS